MTVSKDGRHTRAGAAGTFETKALPSLQDEDGQLETSGGSSRDVSYCPIL